MDDERTGFLSLIDNWSAVYDCAVVTYIALRKNNHSEERLICFGRVELHAAPYDSFSDLKAQHFETEHIIAHKEVVSLKGWLHETLESVLDNGRLNSDTDSECALHTEDNGTLSYHFRTYHPYSISEGPRIPTLYIRGVGKWNLLNALQLKPEDIDLELKAADTPYDSLDELLVSFGLENSESTIITVAAGAPAFILDDSTIINSEVVRLRCIMESSLPINDLKIGVRILRREPKHDPIVDRVSFCGQEFKWQEDESGSKTRLGEVKFRVKDAQLVQVYLSYKNILLHQSWITDPAKNLNPRHIAYRTYDQGLSILQSHLSGNTSKPHRAEDFEMGVATLFSMLGFSVMQMGKRTARLQDGPDILAITPAGHIAVIECTLGHLANNDKMSKLSLRTIQLREEMNKSGSGPRLIQPVIVTAYSREEVSADLSDAEKRGIAVITQEDLSVFFEKRALIPPDADFLFQEFIRRPPNEFSWEQ